MKLPKKVSPDHLKEAVVELKYESNLPFEILLGMFFHALDDSYLYNRTNNALPQPIMHAPGNEITLQVGNSFSVFHHDKISVQMRPNTLVFTCAGEYVGWEQYFKEIEMALRQLDVINQISKWTRIGIRYISHYQDVDLRNALNFSFSFGLPDVKSVNTAFKSEFVFKDARVILNLNNNLPARRMAQGASAEEKITISIVDVDVIDENLNIENLDDVLKRIEVNHTKEKEVYFSLLKTSFLESLNPQY